MDIPKPFKALIFDLDDTLLDTYRCILNPAIIEACQKMISKGLNTDLESCRLYFDEQKQNKPRECFFKGVTQHFGTRDPESSQIVIDSGKKAFYGREVKEDIKLLPHALELLESIKKQNIPIYLVTSGHSETQNQKINKLQIASYFKKIFIADASLNQYKKEALEEILTYHDEIQPQEFLCIGNRRDVEIRAANQLGISTCLIHYGEYVHLQPNEALEIPDFEIQSMSELKQIL